MPPMDPDLSTTSTMASEGFSLSFSKREMSGRTSSTGLNCAVEKLLLSGNTTITPMTDRRPKGTRTRRPTSAGVASGAR